MANIKVPVRWWGGVGNDKVVQREDGHCYADLELGNEGEADRSPPVRTPVVPNYSLSILPLPPEPDFPKREWSGFHETHVDYHLRCYDIKNIVAVGFSQRSCLYQTLNGAVEHNYRVIMLRDCTHSSEYPDTVDERLPEGGWLRTVMLRNFEHVVGYTSTSAEFTAACQ